MSTADEQQARVIEIHQRLQRENGGGAIDETTPVWTPVVSVGGKAGEILQHLLPDEPVFVFRAKDILSVFALEAYADLVEKYNGQGKQGATLYESIQAFRDWQRANPDKIKLPD